MKVVNQPFIFKSFAALGFALSIMAWETRAADYKVTYTHDLDLRESYVGGGNIHKGDVDFGSTDEQSSSIRYTLSPQVTRRALLHFGIEWERISFGVPDSAPVPHTLQQIGALLGMDWQASDKWLFRGELHPGVYSDFHNVDLDHVDVPVFLSAGYLANADLQWFFGVRIDPRSSYPVIPALGVRWKFSDEWTLKAILPEPRLEYELSDQLGAYLGASFYGGTFRMGDNFGDDRGRPRLNGSVLDYFEVRVGPGFFWRIRPEIELGANAGYMVFRRFDFSDEHLVLSSDPAPYVQIACRFRF